MSVKEHLDTFLAYIQRAGIRRCHHDIVLAIAEKTATMMPVLTDAGILAKAEHK